MTNRKNSKRTELILSILAVFSIFTVTAGFRVPNEIEGYFNLGDGVIMLFSAAIHPVASFLSVGFGSALADWVGGYSQFALWTLMIKGAAGMMISLFCRKLGSKAVLPAYLCAAMMMVSGYFVANWTLRQNFWQALSVVPQDVLQVLIGIGIAELLTPWLRRLQRWLNMRMS